MQKYDGLCFSQLTSMTIVHGQYTMCADFLPDVAENHAALADIIYIMYQGRIVEIVEDPAHIREVENDGDPSTVSDIFLTSGSSGRAKDVPLTHDMILRAAYSTSFTRCFERGRRIYMPFPLFHAYSYIEGLIAAQFMGCSVIMPVHKMDIHWHLAMIREKKANDMLSLSSQMTQMILEGRPEPEEYPDLHAVFWGLDTPPWLWDAVRDHFGVRDIGLGLGMTELCSCGVMLSARDPFRYRPLYYGTPKYGGSASQDENGRVISFRIRNPETEEECPPETVGEIVWKGPVITKGYSAWSGKQENVFTEDGWFRSGDLGVSSADGYLRYAGRMTDMYKINGENVSPAFLESVIAKCPAVRMVQCVGIPHPRYGEVGVAFLHLRKDTRDLRREAEIFCRENLAGFQVPKYYIYSDSSSWPKTEGGKISKKMLRKKAEDLLGRFRHPTG